MQQIETRECKSHLRGRVGDTFSSSPQCHIYLCVRSSVIAPVNIQSSVHPKNQVPNWDTIGATMVIVGLHIPYPSDPVEQISGVFGDNSSIIFVSSP